MARSRTRLLERLSRLAEFAVQGTLVEVMLRCGTASCGCHKDPKRRHGPHLYLKFKNAEGRSTSLYIPRTHEKEVRQAVDAWAKMREIMLSLGQLNRDRLARRLRRR
jgi:hypothetical protein